METLERILGEHVFFKGLRADHLQLVTGCASNVRFSAGEYIFREGGSADQFYVLRDGMVAIEIAATPRRSIVIETIGTGDVLGWSWLVAPYRWRFDARVVEPVRALVLDAKCLREKAARDHELGFELLNRVLLVMEQRLQAARVQLIDIYGPAV